MGTIPRNATVDVVVHAPPTAVWEVVGDPRREWEDDLAARLEPGARVLELGCGGGTPETQRLAQRFALTGVDISPPSTLPCCS